jgi:hypothetical protein
MAQAEPLSARAWAELHPRIVKARPVVNHQDSPYPTPERVARVVAELAFEVSIVPDIVTNPELAQHAQFINRFANLSEAEKRFTPTSARAAHRAHLDVLDRKIADGDNSVGDDDHWSYEAFLEDFQIKLRSVKLEKRRLEMEASAFSLPIRLRFANAVDALADRLELKGRERADIFACPFTVPSQVKMLRRLSAEMCDPNQATSGDPANMLPFLNATK